MAIRTDILMRDNDLSIVNGDFEIGVSDPQHVYHILLNPPGSYKQFPLTGLGVGPLLNATFGPTTRREIQLQLEADGYNAKSINVNESGRIEVNFE